MEREARTFYYARVSSKSQNLERQLQLFTQMGGVPEETIIIDKESGKTLIGKGMPI